MATTGDPITTKFEVDISQLKAGIQEANRQIRLVNSEFKAAAAGIDDWANSTDGLQAKIEQLTKVQDAENTKLKNLKEQYRLIAQEQGENSTAAQNLMIKINNQQAAVNKTTLELGKYENKLNELNNTSKEAQNSTEKIRTAYEKLQDTISDQENKLNQLKTSYANTVLEQGKNSASAKQLASDIKKLSSELNKNKANMENAENQANKFDKTVDDLGDSAIESEGGFTVLDGAISSFIGNTVSNGVSKIGEFIVSLFDLSEATEEYRLMMAKTEGSANSFGYSIDFAKGRYKEFYSYLKDDQMATNAITNLMGMKVSTDTVSDSARAAISVWTAYGDSIPIESLTESINETAQVGKVTGALADALNWAGINEDDFNKKLEKTNSTQEAADLIASTLNDTYGESKKTYDNLAGSVIEANKAEIELKETQAELGETLQPLNTRFTELKNKALKSMSPVIADVTKDFKELIDDIDWDRASDDIGDLLDTTVDGLKFTAKNIDVIAPSLKGLVSAWLVYKTTQIGANAVSKTTNAIMTVTKTVTTGLTTATNAATVATNGLNLAQKASPWGLVAGLITGVVVGLGSYIASSMDAKSKTDSYSESTKKLIEDYENLTSELEENKKAREDGIASVSSEIGGIEILANKLEELSQKEQKSNAEKDLMKYYVNELNKAIPNLNLQYDAEKDSLNKSTQAIKDNIKAHKELLLAKAYQEDTLEIMKDMAKVEKQRIEAIKEQTEANEKLAEAQERFNKAEKEYYEAGQNTGASDKLMAYNNAQLELDELRSEYEKTTEVVNDYTDKIKDLNNQYEETEQLAKDKLNLSEAIKGFDGLVETARKQGIEVPKSLIEGVKSGMYSVPATIEQIQALISFDSAINKAKQQGIEVPNSISEGILNGSISVTTAVQQMENLVEFNDLLSKSNIAGKDVPQFVYDGIISGQYTPAQAVQQMENVIEFNDLLNKSNLAGVYVPQFIYDGIMAGQYTPAQAIAILNGNTKEEADKLAPQIQSAGEKASSGYNSGLGSKNEEIKNTARNMAESGKSELEKYRDQFYNAGGYLGDGIKNGLNDKKSSLNAAIVNIADGMIAGFKSMLRINSPSKVFAGLAKGVPEGIKKGIDEESYLATDSIKDMVSKMVKESDNLNRITVDDLKLGISDKIASIESDTLRLKSKFKNEPVQQVKEINFTQNNYSPKALSRLDIYRQTNNQLFAAKRSLSDV